LLPAIFDLDPPERQAHNMTETT